jgi:lysozyme
MKGVALIAMFEGFSSTPYLDSAHVPTIGYGTILYHNGKKVTMSDKSMTKDEAMKELWYEVNEKCKAVVVTTARYGLELEQHELDALCSFAYNVGVGPVVRRDSTVNRGIRNHDKELICKGMKLYVKAGGHRLRGLVKRRNIEVKVFKGECIDSYSKCGQL